MSDSDRRQRMISSTPRLTPDEVAARTFPTAFRGIAETDVRAFLKRVAEEIGAQRGREQDLMSTIDELEARLRTPRPLDEQELLDALGEETTRLLRSAREAAVDIRSKAEERASRLVHDAHDESERVRHEADEVLGVRTREAEQVAQGLLEEAEQRASDLMRVADERAVEVRASAERYAEELRARVERESNGEIESARDRGAALLEEATDLRERVIADLGRRRELLTGQLEELRSGRDELLDAYRIVKRTFLEATEALAQVEARATATRPVGGSDPADLAAAVAAEGEAARAAGLASSLVDSTPADTQPTDGTDLFDAAATEPAAVSDDGLGETAPGDDGPDDHGPGDQGPGDHGPDDHTADDHTPDAAEAPDAGSADSGSDGDGDGTGPNLAHVDDLFARLRAGAAAGEPGDEAVSAPPETSPVDESPATAPAGGAPAAKKPKPKPAPAPAPAKAKTGAVGSTGASATSDDDADHPAWLTRRDAALAPLRASLVRQVKLAIGNEQNEVLDKVRRQKGRAAAESVLPAVEAQTEAWKIAVTSAISKAYAAAWDGDAPAVPDDLAPALARAMVESLRDRLVATIDGGHEPGETTVQVAERIGARYREWKNRSAESSADDALVAAYARGTYDRAEGGALLTWCLPPDGCCVDCSDNALEPTRKGEDFPTGQSHPPAHAGCRCALMSDAADVDLRAGSADEAVESTSPS